MKILLLTHNFPVRRDISHDAGTFVLSFATALSRLGHEIHVLMPMVEGEKEDYSEFKITWLPWRKSKKKLGKLRWSNPSDFLSMAGLVRRSIIEARRIAKEEGIEYCAAFWAIPAGYFAYQVKRQLGIPYSVWVLGSDIWTYGSIFLLRHMIIKKVIKSAHRVFSNSVYLKKEVEKMFGREATLLYASRFLPLDTPPAEIDNGRINFLFIGRYEKVKGLDVLLKSFAMLLNEKKDIYLYAFGGGELKNEYIKMVDKLGLKRHVSIMDYASPESAVSYLKACSCLVIPSRRESQPVLLMDAIQAGIPVIATTAGDTAEIVSRLCIGKVVDAEDVIGLKNAMTDFINEDNSKYKKNLEEASKTFNTLSFAEEYIKNIKI